MGLILGRNDGGKVKERKDKRRESGDDGFLPLGFSPAGGRKKKRKIFVKELRICFLLSFFLSFFRSFFLHSISFPTSFFHPSLII